MYSEYSWKCQDQKQNSLTQDSLHSFSDSTLLPRKDPQNCQYTDAETDDQHRQRLHNADTSAKPLASESIDRATARYSASFRKAACCYPHPPWFHPDRCQNKRYSTVFKAQLFAFIGARNDLMVPWNRELRPIIKKIVKDIMRQIYGGMNCCINAAVYRKMTETAHRSRKSEPLISRVCVYARHHRQESTRKLSRLRAMTSKKAFHMLIRLSLLSYWIWKFMWRTFYGALSDGFLFRFFLSFNSAGILAVHPAAGRSKLRFFAFFVYVSVFTSDKRCMTSQLLQLQQIYSKCKQRFPSAIIIIW